MADQQFLASFGVDIDESGVSRLQTILTENRTLAESLTSAFDAASESVKAFREEAATDLPTLFSGSGYGNVTENLFGSTGGLKISLNMTEPKKEIASFTSDAKKPIRLSANASAIVSAARTALENVRSLFSETFILNVRANASTNSNSDNSNSRNDSRNRDDTGSAFQRMSSGGRFSRPTDVQVAEDGDAEYIIPVKKESRALPLLRQLLSELSPEARESLTGDGKGTNTKTETEGGEGGDRKAPLSLSPVILSSGEGSFEKSFSVAQPVTEADRPLSVPAVSQPVAKPEQLPASDAPLPPVREVLTAEAFPAGSIQFLSPEMDDDAADIHSELVSALKDRTAAGQEPAAEPQPVIKETIPEILVTVPQPVFKENEPVLSVPVPQPPEKESVPLLSVPDLIPVQAAEEKKEPAPSAPIPDLRGILAEAVHPLVPAPVQSARETFEADHPQDLSALSAVLKPSGEEDHQASTPPASDREAAGEQDLLQAPAALPAVRETFAEADHPLAPAPAPGKESLPSEPALPKQNLSDLVSQLSSVLQPVSNSVTNTSNNLSAPVTINVNAKGSDADRIGRSVYDTAERYLIRTLRGAFA